MDEESDIYNIQNEQHSYTLTLTTSSTYLILEVEEGTAHFWKATFTPNGLN